MRFFDETFEYLTQGLTNPMNRDFDKHEYDSKEYRRYEWAKEYYNLMLNELGAVGWEAIMSWDDSYEKSHYPVTRFLFKRSSRSKNFGTGLGVNMSIISDIAKKRAEDNHFGEPTTAI